MKILCLVVVIAIELLLTRPAFGFAELLRYNYRTCQSCHVSPSGGGVLNGYGRPTGRELLPVVKGYWTRLPDWIDIGANYRYVNANYRLPDGSRVHKKFPMQAEGELALRPVPGLTLDASIGTYGPLQLQEYRRFYAKVNVGDYVTVRAGRFTPAYGWNDPDHTLVSRTALGLGEVYAVEGTVSTKWGELQATTSAGSATTLEGTRTEGVKLTHETERRNYVRAAAFLPLNLQLGLQARTLEARVDAAGAFAFANYSHWLYAIGEFNQLIDEAGARKNVAYAKLGVEPFRGITIFATYEHFATSHKPGLGLQLFPINGVEVSARARREMSKGSHSDELTLLFHSYL